MKAEAWIFGVTTAFLVLVSPAYWFITSDWTGTSALVMTTLLAASTLPFLYNVYVSRRSPLVEMDDPWGWGRSLEWATSSPPPRHNFVTIPRIRSESPAFDLHHPEIAALELEENQDERDNKPADAPDVEGRAEMLRERGAHDPEENR